MSDRRSRVEPSEPAAVGELAATIAHQVRNPLAGMKGALAVLRKELAHKPSNLEVVDELVAQIDRLENLVRDLLTFSRPQALSRRAFDLHELLDRVLRTYGGSADASGITVEKSYGPGTGRLVADRDQIEQVIQNLVQNALQAMEEGGTLTVSTRADDASISLLFRDTGKGIPAEEMSKVMQPFYSTRHRGSGLGLPIVRKITKAHDGEFEIESDPGRGTLVTVTLSGAAGD